jgi:hypothetical protein
MSPRVGDAKGAFIMANDGSVGGVGASSGGVAPIPEERLESAVPDFDPAAQSGYITSGELMAWLAVVGGNTYDDMRQQMVGTEQRRELQKDLTSLKATIEEVKTTKDLDKLQAAMAECVAKYQGTPLEARVQEALGTRLATFAPLNEAKADKADADAETASSQHSIGMGGTAHFLDPRLPPEARIQFESEKLIDQLDSWCTEIQGQVDDLGTQDQLALIKIQELNSQVTQATQLASNILAAQDQAASTAIMNIKV